MTFYKTYKEYLRERYPDFKQVRKISINGGFSCPNLDGTKSVGGCTYCNNNSFSAVAEERTLTITQQINQGIERVSRKFKAAGFIAYFQPYTNTYADVKTLERVYREAMSHPQIIGLSIGTRPDCISVEIKDLLAKLAQEKPIMLEIGLQTANDKTLKKINRGHNYLDFAEAMDLCSNIENLDLGVHVIIGLPGEGEEDFLDTAQKLNQWDIKAIKIHPLHIVRFTAMEKQYAKGEISLMSLDDYARAVAKFIKLTNPNCAIERFTGDSPDELHIAPDWSADRNQIITLVEKYYL